MKKEQILERAYLDFTTYGIKRVSMDEVVHNLKISKKTIYEFFSNKDELVLESIKYRVKKELKRLNDLENSSPNLVRGIVISGVEFFKFFKSISPAFYNDLQYYPVIDSYFKDIMKQVEIKGQNKIFQGVEQGYFIKSNNYDVFAKLVQSQIINLEKMAMDKYSPAQLCFICLVTMFRGVCTDKGRKEIELMENEWKNNNINIR